MKFPRPRPIGGWLKSSFVGIAITAVLLVLFVWRLGTLVPGLSFGEFTGRASSQSLNLIVHNPVNAPQRLMQYVLQLLGHSGDFWMRLPSIILATFFIYCFYTISRRWFGRYTGMMGTLLILGTPWVILSARSATPTIMLLSPLSVLAAYHWFKRSEKALLPWLTLVAASAVAIYTPGGFWFVIISAVIARKSLMELATKVSSVALTSGFSLGFLLLLPLGWALFLNPGIWHDFLLIPSHFTSPLDIAKSIGWAASALVWQAPYHIDILLGKLPIMDVTQIVLAVLGVYALWNRAKKELYGILGLAAGGVVLAGINHNLLLLTLCLPSIGLVVAAGLRYLYGEWRSVFPLNPLPRALAVILISSIVGLHLLYGGRYALTAWPHSVATKSSYVLK